MRSIKTTLLAAALLGLAACGSESPVEIDDLIPGDGVSTAEAYIEAAAFLEWDSVRTGFRRPSEVGYMVAAENFGGELNARALLRFSNDVPATLSYNDTTGTLTVDTIPDLVAGRIEFALDTLRTVGDGTIEVAVYEAAEDWDWRSVDWTTRMDTGSVRHEWAEPGGTRGDLIGTGRLLAGDSVLNVIVQPDRLEFFRDSTSNARGVLVQPLTDGARIEFSSAVLHFEMRPRALPDTLMADSASLASKAFIFDSTPDPAGSIVVGGLPSWRSYLRLQERLDTISVPCPGAPAGCTVRLGDVILNHAAIELQRVSGPPGFIQLDNTGMEARSVLKLDGVPLSRAPFGARLVDPVLSVPPERDQVGGGKLAVPVTTLIASLVGDSTMREDAPRTVALLSIPEGGSMGVAAYGSTTSGALAPRLRLIYSVMKEVQAQ